MYHWIQNLKPFIIYNTTQEWGIIDNEIEALTNVEDTKKFFLYS